MRLIKKKKSQIKEFQAKETKKLKDKMRDTNLKIWKRYIETKNRYDSHKVARILGPQINFEKKRK